MQRSVTKLRASSLRVYRADIRCMRAFHRAEILGACAVTNSVRKIEWKTQFDAYILLLRQSSNVPSEGVLFLLEECTLVSTFAVHLLVKYYISFQRVADLSAGYT